MPARLSHESLQSLQQLLYTLVLNALNLPINILPVFAAERASNSHIDHLYTQPCRKILFVRIKTLSSSYKTWIIPSIFYRVRPASSSSPMKFDIIRHHSVILQFHKYTWPTRHHLGKFAWPTASIGPPCPTTSGQSDRWRWPPPDVSKCHGTTHPQKRCCLRLSKAAFFKGEVVSRLLLHLCLTILSLLVLDTSIYKPGNLESLLTFRIEVEWIQFLSMKYRSHGKVKTQTLQWLQCLGIKSHIGIIWSLCSSY